MFFYLILGAEHLNKFVKNYRLHHARKTSLRENLQDIFVHCLGTIHTAKLQEVDWSTIQFLTLLTKGHST